MTTLSVIAILILASLGGYLFWASLSDALDGIVLEWDLALGIMLLAAAGMILSKIAAP